MKEIKVQTVRPVADPKAAKPAPAKGQVGESNFNDTLQQSIARMNDLKMQAEAALKPKESSIKDEINAARDIYDKMMLEKQNLSRLYHRINKTPEDS